MAAVEEVRQHGESVHARVGIDAAATDPGQQQIENLGGRATLVAKASIPDRHRFRYRVGDTRVLCNPSGYPGENRRFVPRLVVEV